MGKRRAQIAAFLEAAGWADAASVPLAGDMSSRRYFRLTRAEDSAVLMDADSPMGAFLRMTEWLHRAGLSAPGIRHAAPDDGLLLLEDFGDISIADRITRTAGAARGIYSDCIDVLLTIRAAEPPALPSPNAADLIDWTRLADQHYAGIAPGGLTRFRAVLNELLGDALRQPPSVSLRDFHADNMMWLPGRSGPRRFGLLDYQDAFLTHPAYDLVSLLTDARVSVQEGIRRDLIGVYLDRSGDDPKAFGTAFAAFSAQRNLRILGIFAQASAVGKARHLAKLPRVFGYFREALDHPAFGDVRDETLRALPAPESVA